jgi:hypothetical protein
MRNLITSRLRYFALITLLACGCRPDTPAETAQVHHVQGTVHGYLEMRGADGHLLASGDSIEVVHGDLVTLRNVFTFKDGSVDDETSVFSQQGRFQLITNHHIQKGPSFPHPVDVTIDAHSGQVTVRAVGKDGKDSIQTKHVSLPPDLANGMVPVILENIPPEKLGTTATMLVLSPKPRVVKLLIARQSEDPFLIGGESHKAIHYEIKIQIGGVAGFVAPLIGKAPPNIQIWIVGGQAPVFVREQGPTYADGPVMTIELASPVWPDSSKRGG